MRKLNQQSKNIYEDYEFYADLCDAVYRGSVAVDDSCPIQASPQKQRADAVRRTGLVILEVLENYGLTSKNIYEQYEFYADLCCAVYRGSVPVDDGFPIQAFSKKGRAHAVRRTALLILEVLENYGLTELHPVAIKCDRRQKEQARQRKPGLKNLLN